MFSENARKTAVVEDMDAFGAWLSTTPFVIWASNKTSGRDLPKSAPSAASSDNSDSDLLAALKSMA